MEGPNVDVPNVDVPSVITAEPSPPFIAEHIPLIVGEEYRTGLSESDLPPIPIELLQSRWLKISHPQGAGWLMRLNRNHNGEPPGGVISENYHRLNQIPDRWGPLQVYNKGGKKSASAASRAAEKEWALTLRPKQPREKDFNGNGFHEAQAKYNELMKETVNDFKVGIELAGTVSSGQGGEYIPPALSQGGLGHYIYHVSSPDSGYLDPGPPGPDELITTGNSESTIYLYCGDGGLDSSFGGTHDSHVPQHTHLTREQWVKKWVYGVISHGFNIDPEPSADFELWEREKIDRNKPVKEDTGGSSGPSGSSRGGGKSKRRSKRKSKRKSKKR